ncbi:MAG: hypothetical protein LBE59_04880, partial [Nevskiaceae bacterium]|nr:hypothetical protein [Nevskiaceae bacterium]
GDVLREAPVDIGARTTAGELHDELAALGARLIVEVLAQCAENGGGAITRRAQASEGVTYAHKLTRDEARIDWTQPAAQVDRNIRAFNPWPGAAALHQGQPLKLLRSFLPESAAVDPDADVDVDAPPGTVLGLRGDALDVVCGDRRVVAITELQRAGRRPVSARDFLNAEPRASGDARMQWL